MAKTLILPMSALCNRNCSYCFIAKKNKILAKCDKDIVDMYNSKSLIDDIKAKVGDNFDMIGLWGTEPTVHLELFINRLEEFITKFDKLSAVQFSTNLQEYTDKIVCLIDEAGKLSEKYNRELKINIQISYDGPEWITDNTRGAGTHKNTVNNLEHLYSCLNGMPEYKNLNVSIKTKSTLNSAYIDLFGRNLNDYIEYLKDFEDLQDDYIKECRAKFVNANMTTWGTLVTPGDYTADNGRSFAEFVKTGMIIERLIKEHRLYMRYYKLIDKFSNESIERIKNTDKYMLNPYLMTCSAGKNQIALDSSLNIHECHRTFFYENKDYINSLNKHECILNSDYIKNFAESKKADIKKWKYRFSGFHKYNTLRMEASKLALTNMAECGLVDKDYLTDNGYREMTAYLSLFDACPAESILRNGSINTIDLSRLKLYGNGAVKEVLKYIEESRNRNEL